MVINRNIKNITSWAFVIKMSDIFNLREMSLKVWNYFDLIYLEI